MLKLGWALRLFNRKSCSHLMSYKESPRLPFPTRGAAVHKIQELFSGFIRDLTSSLQKEHELAGLIFKQIYGLFVFIQVLVPAGNHGSTFFMTASARTEAVFPPRCPVLLLLQADSKVGYAKILLSCSVKYSQRQNAYTFHLTTIIRKQSRQIWLGKA